jgi:hypothetical protein
VPVLNEPFNDGPGPPVISGVIGHAKVVEFDPHSPERLVEVFVVSFGKRTGRNSFLLGADHDRGAMVVRATDKYHGFSRPPEITDVEIGGDIGPEVTQVTGAVGVGEPAGHEERPVAHHYLF